MKQFGKKGFTLIELLVVIAVISMLIAVLMPALYTARERAQSAACMGRLKQWALIFYMYADSNQGYLMQTRFSHHRENWFNQTRHYQGDAEIALCPSADRPPKSRGLNEYWIPENPHEYNYIPSDLFYDGKGFGWRKGDKFSYGVNNWIYNPARRTGFINETEHGKRYDWYWRTPYIKGAQIVPMVGDCWRRAVWIEKVAAPPPYENVPYGSGAVGQMWKVVFTRHGRFFNWAFLDGTVHRIGLRAPWKLKWHLAWDTTQAPYTEDTQSVWPQWLRKHSTEIN